MKTFWNERFSKKEYIYGTRPNEFFKAELEKLTPGTILFPCEGEGRNAVYAATKKWKVYATDQSEAGKEKALKLARDLHAPIVYDIADLTAYQSPNSMLFDAIVLIFGHFPPAIRTKIHAQLIDLLKPGGTFIMEAFNKKQINNTTGGPGNIEMLYNKDILEEDFKRLSISTLLETETELNEGKYHQGKAEVIRLVATKKLV